MVRGGFMNVAPRGPPNNAYTVPYADIVNVLPYRRKVGIKYSTSPNEHVGRKQRPYAPYFHMADKRRGITSYHIRHSYYNPTFFAGAIENPAVTLGGVRILFSNSQSGADLAILRTKGGAGESHYEFARYAIRRGILSPMGPVV